MPREDAPKRPVGERVNDHREIELRLDDEHLERQAARCTDCGVPFCHTFGCPLKSYVPDWNDMVARGHWRRAIEIMHLRNPFPEITGRVCPALCEAACTLSINQSAVSVRQIELQIVERAWENGWIVPERPAQVTGRKVAIVGSGPAALAAAQALARLGHQPVVFERANKVGGILRYGIPDFKLEKWVLDRRLAQLQEEGVVFETGVSVGEDISVRYLRRSFDAVLITAGAGVPRDLDAPGRALTGISFAMDYLIRQNRINAGEKVPVNASLDARDKHVVVIGGGDTGSDCVGTAQRQGAKSITQIELLPEPPVQRDITNPWPLWPKTLRTSTSHEEGCNRLWSVQTKEFTGSDGQLTGLRCIKLEWTEPDNQGRAQFREIPGTEFDLPAGLVLLALGFVRVEHGPLVRDLELGVDSRGNILVNSEMATTADGVFAAGDAVHGASLVVRAIASGLDAAASINKYLVG